MLHQIHYSKASRGQKSRNIPPVTCRQHRQGENLCMQQRIDQSEASIAEIDQSEADNSLSSDVELIIRR